MTVLADVLLMGGGSNSNYTKNSVVFFTSELFRDRMFTVIAFVGWHLIPF
jgi:hypothetical protein